MIKRTTFSLLLAFSTFILASSQAVEHQFPIREVIFSPSNAQIKSAKSIALPKGQSSLVVKNLKNSNLYIN